MIDCWLQEEIDITKMLSLASEYNNTTETMDRTGKGSLPE